jgi:hypothetical protein
MLALLPYSVSFFLTGAFHGGSRHVTNIQVVDWEKFNTA